jgi:hypothetical protein
MYELSGKLKWIGETQTFASGFIKREFVVTTTHDKYPQDIKFEIVKDKCPQLDPLELHQDVTVSFDIRGNEYNGKYYVNLSCWKILPAGEQAQRREGRSPSTTAEPTPDELRNESDFDDAIPF